MPAAQAQAAVALLNTHGETAQIIGEVRKGGHGVVIERMSAGSSAPLELAILISGRGSNMAGHRRACLTGQINAHVRVVISDRPGVAGLAAARDLGIEALTVPWPGADDKEGFERALGEALDARRPQLIVLAGFMRILSPRFVARYAGRMLNIHPSLLPKYMGLHTHRRALERWSANTAPACIS